MRKKKKRIGEGKEAKKKGRTKERNKGEEKMIKKGGRRRKAGRDTRGEGMG